MMKNVEDHRPSSFVVVDVYGELLALYPLLDDECPRIKDLAGVHTSDPLEVLLDRP